MVEKGFQTIEQNSETESEKALTELVVKLVNYFDESTTYKERDVIHIALLKTNKYFAQILEHVPTTRKHVKWKFTKVIQESLKDVSVILSAKMNQFGMDFGNSGGMFSNFRNRNG